MKPTKISSLANAVRKHPYYRAPVLSAGLVESGFSPEEVVIFRRNVEGGSRLQDIKHVSLRYPLQNPDCPHIAIGSSREGIYDSLPEGLFFVAAPSCREQDKHEVIKRIRENGDAEKFVRQFMSLFEAEAGYVQTRINVEELKYDKPLSYRRFPDFFASYWHILILMSPDEVFRMLKILPHVPLLRDDTKGAAKAISFILNLRVEVEKRQVETLCPDFEAPSLCQMRLGDNSVLNGWNAGNPASTLTVTISELSLMQCKRFFKGEDQETVVRYLCDLFFFSAPAKIIIEPRPEVRDCYLSKSRLSVNSYL